MAKEKAMKVEEALREVLILSDLVTPEVPPKLKCTVIPAKRRPYYRQRIPFLIHQTWISLEELSPEQKECMDRLLALNPEYAYCFWGDKDCEDLVGEFDKRLLTLYKSLVPGAFKADLWRACALHVFGGVYLDMDTVPLVSLREIIPSSLDLVLAQDRGHGIWNAFMMSVPEHKAWTKYLTLAMSRISHSATYNLPLTHWLGTKRKRPGCLWMTGPVCLSHALWNSVVEENIILEWDLPTDQKKRGIVLKGSGRKVLGDIGGETLARRKAPRAGAAPVNYYLPLWHSHGWLSRDPRLYEQRKLLEMVEFYVGGRGARSWDESSFVRETKQAVKEAHAFAYGSGAPHLTDPYTRPHLTDPYTRILSWTDDLIHEGGRKQTTAAPPRLADTRAIGDSVILCMGAFPGRRGVNEVLSSDIPFGKKRPKAAFSATKKTGGPRSDLVVRFRFPTLKEQLRYRYLILEEGSSDLIRALYSDSVVMMARPRFETWLGESRLIPWLHYIPLAPDFSDLEEKIKWGNKNPEKCKAISRMARSYALPFLGTELQAKIEKEVHRIFLERIMDKERCTKGTALKSA